MSTIKLFLCQQPAITIIHHFHTIVTPLLFNCPWQEGLNKNRGRRSREIRHVLTPSNGNHINIIQPTRHTPPQIKRHAYPHSRQSPTLLVFLVFFADSLTLLNSLLLLSLRRINYAQSTRNSSRCDDACRRHRSSNSGSRLNCS